MPKTKQTKQATPDVAPMLMAKLKYKIRTADGATIESASMDSYPDNTVFAIYMLINGWGCGNSPRSAKGKKFDKAAHAFLDAAKEYKGSL